MDRLNGWELITLARYHWTICKDIQKRIDKLKEKILDAQASENTRELRALVACLARAKLDYENHDMRLGLIESLMDDDTRNFYYACC